MTFTQHTVQVIARYCAYSVTISKDELNSSESSSVVGTKAGDYAPPKHPQMSQQRSNMTMHLSIVMQAIVYQTLDFACRGRLCKFELESAGNRDHSSSKTKDFLGCLPCRGTQSESAHNKERKGRTWNDTELLSDICASST